MEIKRREIDNNNPLRIMLDASFQEVKILFVLAFNDNTIDDNNNPLTILILKLKEMSKYNPMQRIN